eukprot:11040157-Alexandrium_andersonii.AAC.1
MRGATLNVAAWFANGHAAIERAATLRVDWIVLQELRIDPRQAVGVGNRFKDSGISVAFAALPSIPKPPVWGKRTRAERRGGIGIA